MFSFFKKKEVVKKESKSVYKEDYTNIEPIAKYFYNETGITFDNQISILKSKVSSFCRQRKIASFSRLLEEIKSNTQLKQEIIDYLTTNETFFYREFKQVQELVSLVKDSSQKVKILCAPSATGEEPYSIAIALLEAGISSNAFYIVGIDINSDAITKAKFASYGERNVRNLSPDIIEKYFTVEGVKYLLNESVTSLVSFEVCNIFDSSFSTVGKFDFIFSRNMLIYFDKETKLRAKAILEDLRIDKNQDVFFGHADLF